MDFLFEEWLKVRSLMTRNVVSCPPWETVASILRTMSSKKIGSVMVVEAGSLVGIVTATDVMGVLAEKGPEAWKLSAESIMASPVISCEEDEYVEDAARLMKERDVSRLAVVKDGRLVGVLTEKDVLSAIPILLRQRLKRPLAENPEKLRFSKGNSDERTMGPTFFEAKARSSGKGRKNIQGIPQSHLEGEMKVVTTSGGLEKVPGTSTDFSVDKTSSLLKPLKEDDFVWKCDVCGKAVIEPSILGNKLLCRSCASFGRDFVSRP